MRTLPGKRILQEMGWKVWPHQSCQNYAGEPSQFKLWTYSVKFSPTCLLALAKCFQLPTPCKQCWQQEIWVSQRHWFAKVSSHALHFLQPSLLPPDYLNSIEMLISTVPTLQFSHLSRLFVICMVCCSIPTSASSSPFHTTSTCQYGRKFRATWILPSNVIPLLASSTCMPHLHLQAWRRGPTNFPDVGYHGWQQLPQANPPLGSTACSCRGGAQTQRLTGWWISRTPQSKGSRWGLSSCAGECW